MRLLATTPKYFQATLIWAKWLAAIGLGFQTQVMPVFSTFQFVHLPEIMIKISEYMIVAGAVSGWVASRTANTADKVKINEVVCEKEKIDEVKKETSLETPSINV